MAKAHQLIDVCLNVNSLSPEALAIASSFRHIWPPIT